MPALTVAKLQRQNHLDSLRAVLRRTNVSEEAANEALQEEENSVSFLGRVTNIRTTNTATTVTLNAPSPYGGQADMLLEFPPNDLRFLPELVRAHTHAHLRVLLEVSYNVQTFKGIIRGTVGMNVFWDDHLE